MQRELYSLLGENTPPISVIQKKFRDKPNWRQKATPWLWSTFDRGDGLKLRHWVKGTQPSENEEYSFAKFDKKLEIPEITLEEYDAEFKDAFWSFEETKYLFELCQDYDLRWTVIHDRYNYKSSSVESDKDVEMTDAADDKSDNAEKKSEDDKSDESDKSQDKKKSKALINPEASSAARGLEDLKARYFEVRRALLKIKQSESGLSPDEEDQLKQMRFSKESERRRKDHLERLLSRSPAEIAEEEALVIESRKLEAAAERMLNERAEILRLLDAPQTTASIAQYSNSQGIAQLTNMLLTDKSKKRKEEETPTPDAVSSAPTSASKSAQSTVVKAENTKKAAASAIAAVVQKKLSAREEAAFGISYHDKLTPGVQLRSSKVTTFKPVVMAKVTQVLGELGLTARPVMPTAKVCAKFDSLQHSIGVLLEAKKQADKLDAEIRVLRAQNNGQ